MQDTRLQKLLQFLEDEPNDEFLQYALATEYLRLNDTDRALQYYEKLVVDHPNYTVRTKLYRHTKKVCSLPNKSAIIMLFLNFNRLITRQPVCLMMTTMIINI
jgi:tetratricopeptide (TPR) repeat protein